MNIAIVSANEIQQSRTIAMLEEYASKLSIEFRTTYFLASENLLKEVKLRGGYDMYILDVLIPDVDGILLGERLRARGDNGIVLYINGEPSRAWRAFRIRADDYLLSPVHKELFREAMDRAVNMCTDLSSMHTIEFRLKNGIMRDDLGKLTYIDKSRRSCRYHFSDGKVYEGPTVRGTFEACVEEFLCYEELYLAGKSLLLNLRHIRLIDANGIILSNGEVVHPPKSRYEAVSNAWKKYSDEMNER